MAMVILPDFRIGHDLRLTELPLQVTMILVGKPL